MECQRCLSGYRVYENETEKFCGFCKTHLKDLDPKLQSHDKLTYIDNDQGINVTVLIKNVGVVEVRVDGIEFV